jgi:hypothetical protein
MIKKIFGYLVLISCCAAYFVSSSDGLSRKLMKMKLESGSLFGSDKFKYGDLYGLSYLPDYKILLTPEATIHKDSCAGEKSINLYALVDSYIFSFFPADSFYCGVENFFYCRSTFLETRKISLDTSKSNILLLEMAERNLYRLLMDNYDYLGSFLDKDAEPPKTNTSNGVVFNKNINQNLENIFWDSRLFTPVKELRSLINYTLLGKVEGDVLISADSEYLLYAPTVDTSSYASSFKFISDTQIDTLVARLNFLYNKYKQSGFDEVYLSIIPNSVSILYPGYKSYTYNMLLERVQGNAALQIRYFDVFRDFKNSEVPLYFRSDSHWNMNGAILWLNKLNIILERHAN